MGSEGLKGPLLAGGSVDVFWVVFFFNTNSLENCNKNI